MALARAPCSKVPAVRRTIFIGLLFLAGCGGASETRENRLRPAAPVTMSAAIRDDRVQISPRTVGAGQIVIVISNQSDRAQRMRFETDELGGTSAGQRARSTTIAPRATGRLTIDARRGVYSVRTEDDDVRAARVRIGPPRRSSQDQLLLP